MASVISAKDFVEGGYKNYQFTPVKKNAQGKPEMSLNKPLLIQYGTTEDPLVTRGGAVRWNASSGKYESITGNADWATADRSGYYNKMTKKVHAEVRLTGYDKEGTSAYWATEASRIIINMVVDAIVNGVPDGNGGISKVYKDEEVTEPMVRRSLTTPLQEAQPVADGEGFYPPTLKLKVRYYVKTPEGETASAKTEYTAEQLSNFKVTLEPRIYDGAKQTSSPVNDPISLFVGGAPGVWIAQVNSVFFKGKTEINLTEDLKIAKFFARKSFASTIDFIDEPVGGFGKEEAVAQEPEAKRAKTESAATTTTEDEKPLFVA